MALSGLIRHLLVSVAEREQQRRRLISLLILAQFLFALAVTPGYLTTHLTPAASVALALVVLSMLVALAAYAINTLLHNVAAASYVLVFGGGLAFAAHIFGSALTGNPADAARASLFLLVTILEAGLLFAPEVALITAAAAGTLSAAGILLALALHQQTPTHEAYLLVVETLSLQAITSLIAWLLAQFIFESTVEAQRSQELQFAQARLDALISQSEAQQGRLDQGMSAIQSTISRAIGGEYTARVEVRENDLTPIANSLNLLLDRIESAIEAEQVRARMEAAALPLIEAMGRMSDASNATPTPSSLPIMTNTPLDSISVALSHMQASISRRMGRVQKLASEVTGAVVHSRDGLNSANDEVRRAQQLAGQLIPVATDLATSAVRQIDMLVRARRMLALLLPEEITQMPVQDELHRDAVGLTPDQAAALIGLGIDLDLSTSGHTQEFAALAPISPAEAGIAPMTVPLPAINLQSASSEQVPSQPQEPATEQPSTAAGSTTPSTPSGDFPAELVEAWRLVARLSDGASLEERATRTLARELGVLSRSVRQADQGIAWVLQALDAIRRDAEQLQQAAGTHAPPPEAGDQSGVLRAGNAPSSRPLAPGVPPRTPALSRPLSDVGTLDEATLAALANEPRPSEEGAAPGSLRASDLIGDGN